MTLPLKKLKTKMILFRALSLLFFVSYIATFAAAAGSHHDPNYQAPETVPGSIKIDYKEAKNLHDQGVLFLDVRGGNAYEKSRIANAQNLDVRSAHFTQKNFKHIVGGPTQEVVIYCNGIKCTRSPLAVRKAVKWGYKKVYYFRGGFPDWITNDFPIE